MDISQILSINNLTKGRLIERRKYLRGLIDTTTEKRKLFYMEKDLFLGEIIEMAYEKSSDYKMSISEIINMIDELYISNDSEKGDDLDQKISRSSMHSSYKAFLDKIGGHENYYSEEKLSYSKNMVPIVIFLVVMCSSKKSLLNMYINKTQEKQIQYSDVKLFFVLLWNYLEKYVDDQSTKAIIYNSFVKLFKFSKLQSYSVIASKIEKICTLISELDKKHPDAKLASDNRESESLIAFTEFEHSMSEILDQYEAFFINELEKRKDRDDKENTEELMKDFELLKSF